MPLVSLPQDGRGDIPSTAMGAGWGPGAPVGSFPESLMLVAKAGLVAGLPQPTRQWCSPWARLPSHPQRPPGLRAFALAIPSA